MKSTLLNTNLNKLYISKENTPGILDKPHFFENISTPIERYTQLFNSIIPDINLLTNEQKKFLIYSYNLFAEINDRIDIFTVQYKNETQNDLKCSFILSGGSILDFLFNKIDRIKDFDFIMNIYDQQKTNEVITRYSKMLNQYISIDSPFFHNSNYKIQSIPLEFSNQQTITDISQKIFKNDNIIEIFNERSVKQYLENSIKLNTKIKINHNQNLNYNLNNLLEKNIDIVFTSMEPTSFVLNFYNFGICKNFILNHQNNSNLNISEEDKINIMYNNLIFSHTALKDINDKTFYLNTSQFSKEHIDYFLNKHYLKLKTKFPDFSLLTMIEQDYSFSEETIEKTLKFKNNLLNIQINQKIDSLSKEEKNQHIKKI